MKYQKFRYLLCILLIVFILIGGNSVICAATSPIPADRSIDWSQSGIPGGIPERTEIYTTIEAADYGNGTVDATAAIQAALDSCPQNKVVLLSEGTFRINTQIIIPSYVTLRGAGSQETILDMRGSGSIKGVIAFGKTGLPGWPPPGTTITGGLEKGSNTITLDSTEGVTIGCYLLISQLNDPDYVSLEGAGGTITWNDEGWNGTRASGQIVEVTSVNGSSVGISPALYMTYKVDLEPLACPFEASVKYAGAEDLQVYANNSGYLDNIHFQAAAYCWVKNIESNYADGDHVRLFYSYRCEVRDSYFHDGFIHGGGSTDDCILFGYKTSACRVENNILRRLHVGVMLNWGAAGNVIAYNFVDGGFKEAAPNFTATGISTHGAHPMYNLFEGNVMPDLNLESYWGSTSHNTAFRNWLIGTTFIREPLTGRGPEQYDTGWWSCQANRAVCIDYQTRYTNLAGNIVGSPQMLAVTHYNDGKNVLPSTPIIIAPAERPYDSRTYGYSFGFLSPGDGGVGMSSELGNDKPYTTAFIHGDYNWVDGSTTWDSETSDQTLPASLYLTEKPDWFGSAPWPAIGSDVDGYVNKIPAQLRWENEYEPSIPTPPPPPPSVIIDDADERVEYVGNPSWNWNHAADSGCYNNTRSHTRVADDYAQLSFEGTDIEVYCMKTSQSGMFDVYIDGVYDSTVDTYNPSNQTKVKVYEKSGLSNGPHTIRIQNNGQKNDSSSDTYIFIDYFKIFTDETPTPELEPAITFTGPSLIDGLTQFSLIYGLEDVEGITAQEITVSYDENLFDFISANPLDEDKEYDILDLEVDDEEAGVVNIVLAIPNSGITGDADILELKFIPKAGGTGTIAIAVRLADGDDDVFPPFELPPMEASISIEVTLGKALLESAIQTAQGIYNDEDTEEGIMPGQYPAGTKSKLDAAITIAVEVYENENATEQQISEAITALNAAVAKFQSLIITTDTGNFNNYPGIDVGDLGKIALFYGKTFEDAEWDDIKHMDINGDGEIGLYELAFIARRMVLKDN